MVGMKRTNRVALNGLLVGRRFNGRLAIAIMAIALMASLLTSTGLAASASAQSGSVYCSSQPYATQAVAPSVLQECGMQQFPLASVSILPDNGASYNYVVDGEPLQFLIPPSTFNPVTAPASELAIYGMQRPSNATQLATWNLQKSNLKWSIPDPYYSIAISPSSESFTHSTNWSGYVSNNGGFSTIDTVWNQPSNAGCSNAVAGIWGGIGSGAGAGAQLAQDGFITSNVSFAGLNDNEGWFEMYPQTPNPLPTNPTIHISVGDQAQVSVLNKGSNVWQYALEDDTTGAIRVFNFTASSAVDTSQSEGIVERPTTNVNFPGISTINFQVSADYTPLGSLPPLTQDDLYGLTGNQITQVSTISGSNYSVRWTNHCN